jgi:hypothetical protein
MMVLNVRTKFFYRSRGNIPYCHSLFKRAVTKDLDYPDRLLEAWTRLEHEQGTVASLRDARVMMRRKAKLIAMQWQQVQ